jgi:hypothetical protein
MPGYCTEEDVRLALQEASLVGELGSEFVQAAIEGQSEWVRKRTDRHWYDAASQGGDGDLYASTRSLADDVCSVPTTPHPRSHRTLRDDDRRVYPQEVAGQYTRIRLAKRGVASLTRLAVRDVDGDVTDWVADATYASGRGEDYYLQVDPEHAAAHVYLDTRSLPRLWDYADAVVAAYEYGEAGVPESVRRAVAFRAGAELVLDDDVTISVPDQGQLVNVETKAQAMRKRARELLAPYTEVPIA